MKSYTYSFQLLNYVICCRNNKLEMMSDRVLVVNDVGEDNSIVRLSPVKMRELGIKPGDLVYLQSRLRYQTVCVALPVDKIDKNNIVVNPYVLVNLVVKQFEQIKISPLLFPVTNGSRISVLPFEDSVKCHTPIDLYNNYLRPYFIEAFRPVMTGDVFGVKGNCGTVEFKVLATEPMPYCVVAPETVIYHTGTPLKRECEMRTVAEVSYDDIGGCNEAIKLIREVVELPIRYPVIFQATGIKPPKGVLLYGPPGTGKTLIAKAVSSTTNAAFFSIDGPELISKFVGESELNLRKVFHDAAKRSPAIIFIDEIDSIAPKREKICSESDKRMVAQLLTLMDGLSERQDIFVMAATNQRNSIDPALRRNGRLDREIEIGVPTAQGRLDILKIHTSKMKLSDDVDLGKLASVTHGFVGSDLAGLCVEAATLQIKNLIKDVSLAQIDVKQFENMKITQKCFQNALLKMKPCCLRTIGAKIPKVTWGEVGGLEVVKSELKQLIQYPILYPKEFKKLDLSPSKGILLFGPPGCGKTLIGKAIAHECGVNFISVKGSDIFNKWLGESEANVKDIFSKARSVCPCILFFDEFDSIAEERSNGGCSGARTANRIVNEILIEMDGLTSNDQVFFVGATNRPDRIDPAFLRPGRIDQQIYIPLPDLKSRMEIFSAKLKTSPLDDAVNVETLADNTEGFSGADIAEVCRKAKMLALEEMMANKKEKSNDVKLTLAHFEGALQTCCRSVTDAEAKRCSAYNRNRKGQFKGDDDEFKNYYS